MRVVTTDWIAFHFKRCPKHCYEAGANYLGGIVALDAGENAGRIEKGHKCLIDFEYVTEFVEKLDNYFCGCSLCDIRPAPKRERGSK